MTTARTLAGIPGHAPLIKESDHLLLNTQEDGKTVKINSRDYNQASGSSIGLQSKPNQAATSTGSVTGAEFQPRIADGKGVGNVIGAEFGPILKGTSGTITGDVRGCQVDLTDENAAGRTISGDVIGMRIFMQLAAHTFSGHVVPFKVEAPGGGKSWDAVLKLASNVAGIWNATPGTEPSTADGYIKVLVNGLARYIQLYSTAPTD